MKTVNRSSRMISSTSLTKLGYAGAPLSSVPPLALEPRFMFDAAGAVTGIEAAQDSVAENEAQEQGNRMLETIARERAEREAAEREAADSAEQVVVFVDRSVEGYEELLAGLDPDAEVIFIEPGQDGIEQMAAALEGREDISAIHIISHGDVGEVNLGNAALNADNLDSYSEALAAIRDALSEDGDVLLYGCGVGADGEGRAFIESLSEALEADIAASDDLTGDDDLGGDWDLELEVGSVEAGVFVSKAGQDAFDGVLKKGTKYHGLDENKAPAEFREGKKTFKQHNVEVKSGGREYKFFNKNTILNLEPGGNSNALSFLREFKVNITGIKDLGKEKIRFKVEGKTYELTLNNKDQAKSNIKFGKIYRTISYDLDSKGGGKYELTFKFTDPRAYQSVMRGKVQAFMKSLRYVHEGEERTVGERTFKYSLTDTGRKVDKEPGWITEKRYDYQTKTNDDAGKTVFKVKETAAEKEAKKTAKKDSGPSEPRGKAPKPVDPEQKGTADPKDPGPKQKTATQDGGEVKPVDPVVEPPVDPVTPPVGVTGGGGGVTGGGGGGGTGGGGTGGGGTGGTSGSADAGGGDVAEPGDVVVGGEAPEQVGPGSVEAGEGFTPGDLVIMPTVEGMRNVVPGAPAEALALRGAVLADSAGLEIDTAAGEEIPTEEGVEGDGGEAGVFALEEEALDDALEEVEDAEMLLEEDQGRVGALDQPQTGPGTAGAGFGEALRQAGENDDAKVRDLARALAGRKPTVEGS